MNVEMSALNIQKMSQSHPISRRGKKTQRNGGTVLIQSDLMSQSPIKTAYCQ